jgi:hypothetical protein
MVAAKPKKTGRQQHCDDAAADKMKGAAWCQREYVNAKDCDDWVANECEWNLKKDSDDAKHAGKDDKQSDSDDAKQDGKDDKQSASDDAKQDGKDDKQSTSNDAKQAGKDDKQSASDDAGNIAGKASNPGPVMLAALPGAADALTAHPMDGPSDAELNARRQQNCDEAAVDKSKRAAWCQRQRVDAASCEKWVARECNFKKQDGKASTPSQKQDGKHDKQRHSDDAKKDGQEPPQKQTHAIANHKKKANEACHFTDQVAQCYGLQQTSASTYTECQTACCNDVDCEVWQFDAPGSSNQCWAGKSEQCSGGSTFTYGGRKAAKPAADIDNKKAESNAAPASLSVSAGRDFIRNSSFVCLMISLGMLAHLGYSFMHRRRLRKEQESGRAYTFKTPLMVNDPEEVNDPEKAYMS